MLIEKRNNGVFFFIEHFEETGTNDNLFSEPSEETYFLKILQEQGHK